jgi:predicted metal-dependent hydrolase
MTPQLKEAIELFNRGDYFAASERFEQAASELDAQLKETVLALNRIAAALHLRFARGLRQGPINLLSQALFSLEDLGPQHAGIDLERLRSEISACVEQIRSTGRTAHGLKYRAQLFVARRRAPKIRLRT